jgi:hypothetical protein
MAENTTTVEPTSGPVDPSQNKAPISKAPEPFLGPYLHLAPLRLSALPDHSAFSRPENAKTLSSSSRPDLSTFIESVIAEALKITDDIPKWHRTGSKDSKPASGAVSLFSKELTSTELRKTKRDNQILSPPEYSNYPQDSEYWFARKSEHRDEATKGTASWGEFVGGLRDNHSENEGDYTPDVYDARLILDWGSQISNSTISSKFEGLTMRSKLYFFCM